MVSDVRRIIGASPTGIALTGIILASIPLAVTAAAAGAGVLAASAMAAGQFVEWYARGDRLPFHKLLTRASFDAHLRAALRAVAMPVLLMSMSAGAPVVIAAWSAWLLWLAASAAGLLVKSREIALDGVSARGLGPEALRPDPNSRSWVSNWPHTAGFLLTAALTPLSPVMPWLGVATLAGVTMLYLFQLVRRLQRTERLSDAKRLARLNAAIAAYRPEVILYVGGRTSSGYQANVWLPTIDKLTQRAIVIIQSPVLWTELHDCVTPVVCVQRATDYLTLDLSSARLALFPGNNGNNINLLRLPHLRHAFVGHGDSDKIASINPFTKVYDEIWVAGQAGQDRFATAGIPIPAERFVHVGRPQLTKLAATPPRQRDALLTVLYAPTWEGWTLDEHHTSLIRVGADLIKALQQVTPSVKIIFRPHPLTGSRSPATAAARDALTALLPATAVSDPNTSELYDCFNQADLLITDVSSVISDFLATGKPYAVINTSGLPSDEFIAVNPTASAAYLIDGELNGLTDALNAARMPDLDLLAARRSQLRTHILGPTGSDAPFQEAVDRAIAAAERRVMA